MTFLNPLVLFALAAAAIPLAIHLFNFRRPRRIDYSSLAFLVDLHTSTTRRLRIKQWLLLALRTLAIVLLVLVFSRPTLRADSSWLGGGNWSVAVVVDPSLSMSLRNQRGAYLDQARNYAQTVITSLDPSDEVFVATPGGDYIQGQTGAAELLREMDVTERTHSVSDELYRAGRYLEDNASYVNRRVYYLGDLQESTLVDSASAMMPGSIPATLLSVTGAPTDNLAVIDVDVDSRIVEHGQPIQITATIRNFGANEVGDRPVSLFLGDRRVAQTSITVPARGIAEAQMTMTQQGMGWVAGTVEVEDDAFLHDNKRYFSVYVPRTRRALVVRGAGATAQFVLAALSSRLERGSVPTEYEVVENAVPPPEALSRFDVVILLGKAEISSGERNALMRYVQTGGGLLLFPSASAQMEDHNALFQLLGGGVAEGVVSATTGAPVTAEFDNASLAHPLFEGVFANAEYSVESVSVQRMLRYVPRSGTETTVVRLSNGDPLLQELRKGRGIVFVYAVAPDLSWSDLPLRGLFVPLLYRSIQYLSAGSAVQGEQLTVGQPATVTIPSTGARLRVVAPNGRDAVPEQRHLYGSAVLDLGAILTRQGVYEVRSDDAVIRLLGANIDARESDLMPASTESAVAKLTDVLQTDVIANPASPSTMLLQAGPAGVELWKPLLLLVIVCLIAELAVSSIVRSSTARE